MKPDQELIDVQPQETNHELTIKKPGAIQPVAIDPEAPLMTQIMQLTQQGTKLDVEYIKGLVAIKKGY